MKFNGSDHGIVSKSMQVSKEPSIGIVGLSLQELNEAGEARPCQGSRRSAYGDATSCRKQTEDGLKLFNNDGMMGDKNLNRF